MNIILAILKNRYAQYVLIALLVFGYYQSTQKSISVLRTQLEVARVNEKALKKGVEIWKDRYGREHSQSIMFSNSIAQLKAETDSTSSRMLTLLEEQGKEIKKLKQIGYVESQVNTTLTKEIDIIQMPDTIIDLSDRPHLTNLIHLSPKNVSSEISFKNETIISIEPKREPIAPLKRTTVGRFFQKIFAKKHIVTTVELMNTNPYIENKNQRFIEITK